MVFFAKGLLEKWFESVIFRNWVETIGPFGFDLRWEPHPIQRRHAVGDKFFILMDTFMVCMSYKPGHLPFIVTLCFA